MMGLPCEMCEALTQKMFSLYQDTGVHPHTLWGRRLDIFFFKVRGKEKTYMFVD